MTSEPQSVEGGHYQLLESGGARSRGPFAVEASVSAGSVEIWLFWVNPRRRKCVIDALAHLFSDSTGSNPQRESNNERQSHDLPAAIHPLPTPPISPYINGILRGRPFLSQSFLVVRSGRSLLSHPRVQLRHLSVCAVCGGFLTHNPGSWLASTTPSSVRPFPFLPYCALV